MHGLVRSLEEDSSPLAGDASGATTEKARPGRTDRRQIRSLTASRLVRVLSLGRAAPSESRHGRHRGRPSSTPLELETSTLKNSPVRSSAAEEERAAGPVGIPTGTRVRRGEPVVRSWHADDARAAAGLVTIGHGYRRGGRKQKEARSRPSPVAGGGRTVGSGPIWLILPVVICLSQRLSHACLSTNSCTVKPRMAH